MMARTIFGTYSLAFTIFQISHRIQMMQEGRVVTKNTMDITTRVPIKETYLSCDCLVYRIVLFLYTFMITGYSNVQRCYNDKWYDAVQKTC